jgi:hypothetical protein
MRLREAEWIATHLTALPVQDISPLLELGSQTLEYRTVHKPHIEELIHRPLRARGVKIITTDLKQAPGIEIPGDIFDPQVQDALRGASPNLILCSGIIPHVRDPKEFAEICNSLVKGGKYLIITTVQSYPYTIDPIDNGFRATPEDIAELFPDCEVISSDVLATGTYLDELRETRRPVRALLGVLGRTALFRGGLRATMSRSHRLLWMFRPFTVSVVLLRKSERASPYDKAEDMPELQAQNVLS